ncbi:MAG: aminoglycoside nucleotidyltransferase [Pseudomonadota bacterium]
MTISPQTPATTVLWLISQSEGAIWLDGGWGVDALIGTQTRAHEDVDIVLEERHAPLLVDCLRLAGFEDVPRDDTRPCNFVLGSSDRGLVDFHLVRFDPDGNGVYGIPKPEGVYPAEAFTGRGEVLGQPVRCMSAIYQMENHSSGYALRAKDFADMQALAAATGMPLPKHFR